jgi:hypothetical protein
MAKQYIPGISGLLTEPNPADSPSNTLSEAENVVIEQGGKVQSRHGFNIKETENEANFYDDINAISDTSLAGNYSFMSGAAASPFINYSGSNLATVVEIFPGNSNFLTTINGTATEVIVSDVTTVPYPTSLTTYYSRKITENPNNANHYYTIETPASKSNVSSDGNIPTTASIFVKRNSGSCVLTVTFGIGFSSIYIPVGFNLDTLTYQIDPQWIASTFNAVKYFDANIQSAGSDWYKISITCQFRTDLSTGVVPYNPYYITIYPRMSNEEDPLGSGQNQFELPYNGTPYTSGLAAQTYVAGAESTRLNVSALSTAPYLRVGDYIQFLPSQVLPGLTADKNYRISEVNTVSNYIVIQHPGQTTTGSLTNRTFTSKADYTVSYLRIYQNPNLNYSEFTKIDSTIYDSFGQEVRRIVTGTTTRLIFDTNDQSSTFYPNITLSLVKPNPTFTGYVTETNLPSGMYPGESYKIVKTGLVLETTGIYAGFYVFYIDIDVVTTGSTFTPVNSVYLKTTALPVYIADISVILPNYNYANQYTFALPTVKLLEYKDSSDAVKTLLFVKQTKNAFSHNQTGIYSNNNTTIQNRYYIVDDNGILGKYERLKYSTINNAFVTKESLYLQTENGLAETNIDSVDSDEPNKFFDIKWPAFPEISVKTKVSNVVKNWLTVDTYCLVRITFFREMGYTDKEGLVYESSPSNPIIVNATTKNTIPELYIDFRTLLESSESYKVFNEFIANNKGRKFGIRVYRTLTDSINSEAPPVEYRLACPPIYFDNFMASGAYVSDLVGGFTTKFALRDALEYYPVSSTQFVQRVVDYPVELNVGDIVNIAYDLTQSSGTNKVIGIDEYFKSTGTDLTNVRPYKHSTQDSYIQIRDFKVARLEVISKELATIHTKPNVYVYQFKATDKIVNTRNNATFEKNQIITLGSLVSDISVISEQRKLLLMRSYGIDLDTNDNGIRALPELYTNPNYDGEDNTNIMIPKASNSFAYKDFRVYYGIQKPLVGSIFTIKQPRVEQIYFNHLANGTANPSSSTFYLQSQSILSPKVGETTSGLTASGGRLFLDSSVFVAREDFPSHKSATRDVEVLTLNDTGVTSGSATANRMSVYYDGSTQFAPATFTYNDGTTADYSNQSMYNSYRFNATLYEQGKLSIRLTSLLDVVNEVTIKTTPFYNRRGYYRKYTTIGFEDQEYLYFDLALDEGNGAQLTDFNDLMQRQYAKILRPSPTYNATSPAFGKNVLSAATGYGVFNIPGNGTNQYPPDGKVKGFSTADTNGRGFYFDQTNGKFFIRNDGTKGATSNTFDLNKFTAPGHIMIQHVKSVDGTGTLADWNSRVISVYSYKTASQTANGIYELGGIAPVVGDLSTLVGAASIQTDVLLDLYFLNVSNASNIVLYPYSEPPSIRELRIVLSKAGSPTTYLANIEEYCSSIQVTKNGTLISGATESQNSPAEPFFTTHKHVKRSQREVARISTVNNNLYFVQNPKSETTLLDDYTNSIIDAFNLEFRLKGINAMLLPGDVAGEIAIQYPDGKKIEMRSDYGSHEFFPSLTPLTSSSFVTLAERTNNEYNEKNMIQWSRIGIPEITTPMLYAYLGKNDKEIIGHAANTDDFYIFKEDGIWRCTFGGVTNPLGNEDIPAVETYIFSTNVICQSANSIQEINDEIIFLSQYGFMSIAGGSIQNISKGIESDILNLLSVTPKDRVRSFVNEARNLYFCTLINETEPALNVKSGTYVFNIKTRQWSFMDEEVLDGIQDSKGRTLAVYRQRPVQAKLAARVSTDDGVKPVLDFTQSHDVNSKLLRATEATPIDLFYITREQLTNNVKSNAVDQYDFATRLRYENAVDRDWIQKSGTNEFFIRTETIPSNTQFRNKFYSSVETLISSSYLYSPAIASDVSVIDSFVTLFANRSLYIKRNNGSAELFAVRLKKTGYSGMTMLVYFEFVSTPPDWFSAMSNGYFNTGGTATYQILAGIPVKITFNPESGSQPDTNKLFQEYMIHTETNNKGALMAFKTDSRTNFTGDRRFVYDAAATNRNVFRTYIPTIASRGRYLIRQVKHDVPLENLIITGQTMVMRDSGSTRVQKDRDNE